MAEAARKLKVDDVLTGKPCATCGAAFAAGEDVAVCDACESAQHAACWAKKGGCANASCADAPTVRATTAPTSEVAAPCAPADVLAAALADSGEKMAAGMSAASDSGELSPAKSGKGGKKRPTPSSGEKRRASGDKLPHQQHLSGEHAPCRHCGKSIQKSLYICPLCKKAQTPDGVPAPRRAPASAIAALVCGIAGLLLLSQSVHAFTVPGLVIVILGPPYTGIAEILLGIAAFRLAGVATREIRANSQLEARRMIPTSYVLGAIDILLGIGALFPPSR